MKDKNIKALFEESISLKKSCLEQGLGCISVMGDEACKSIQNNAMWKRRVCS